MHLRPNPACDDSFCQQRQAEAKAELPKQQESVGSNKLDDKEVTHEDNEWGMCSYVIISYASNAALTLLICDRNRLLLQEGQSQK
jgi:hypothetical protein